MNKEAIEKARLAIEKTQYTDAQKQSIYDNAMQVPDIAVMCGNTSINKETTLKALQIGLDNTNELKMLSRL